MRVAVALLLSIGFVVHRSSHTLQKKKNVLKKSQNCSPTTKAEKSERNVRRKSASADGTQIKGRQLPPPSFRSNF
jgi:hypothetical protein